MRTDDRAAIQAEVEQRVSRIRARCRSTRRRAGRRGALSRPEGLPRPLGRRRSRALRTRHASSARPAARLHGRGLFARPGAAADQARALPAVPGPARPHPDTPGDRWPQRLQGRVDRRRRQRRRTRGRLGNRDDPARAHPPLEPRRAGPGRQSWEAEVSKEIVEAVQTLEKEKGISSERLMLPSRTRSSPHTRRHRARPGTRAWTWTGDRRTSACSS